VRPTAPRPKVERRERRGKANARGAKPGERRRKVTGRPGAATEPVDPPAVAPVAGPSEVGGPSHPHNDRRGGGRRARSGRAPRDNDDDEQESNNMSDTELAEQGEVVRSFLVDLLDAFGLDGEVTATPAEEGAVELAVTGDDLGLLIGPKGATLQAVQELSRSMLQRQLPGEAHARIRVDVSGYRARRKVALEGFVRTVAEDVLSSGARKALEPMAPPDRKVVHDTVNEIDGVHTISEGEDARRRVVIIPDA